MRFNFKYYQR